MSIAEIETVAASPLFEFCSRQGQGVVQEVLSVLRTMQRGYPPTFTHWGGCAKMTAVKEQLQYLFTFAHREVSEEEEVPFGSTALSLLPRSREAENCLRGGDRHW